MHCGAGAPPLQFRASSSSVSSWALAAATVVSPRLLFLLFSGTDFLPAPASLTFYYFLACLPLPPCCPLRSLQLAPPLLPPHPTGSPPSPCAGISLPPTCSLRGCPAPLPGAPLPSPPLEPRGGQVRALGRCRAPRGPAPQGAESGAKSGGTRAFLSPAGGGYSAWRGSSGRAGVRDSRMRGTQGGAPSQAVASDSAGWGGGHLLWQRAAAAGMEAADRSSFALHQIGFTSVSGPTARSKAGSLQAGMSRTRQQLPPGPFGSKTPAGFWRPRGCPGAGLELPVGLASLATLAHAWPLLASPSLLPESQWKVILCPSARSEGPTGGWLSRVSEWQGSTCFPMGCQK